ncbi:MAG: hypothetical protein WDN69_27225 [Aliidongia sp.]
MRHRLHRLLSPQDRLHPSPKRSAIAAWLSEREEAEKQRIRDSARRLHDETAALGDEMRIAGGLPCALLADGVCSVYEARPLTCRAIYSYDRAACERFFSSMISRPRSRITI